jgi:hypothetical protein
VKKPAGVMLVADTAVSLALPDPARYHGADAAGRGRAKVRLPDFVAAPVLASSGTEGMGRELDGYRRRCRLRQRLTGHLVVRRSA